MSSPFPILDFSQHPSKQSFDEMPPPMFIKLERTLSHVSQAEKDTFEFMDVCENGKNIFANYWTNPDSITISYLFRDNDIFYRKELYINFNDDEFPVIPEFSHNCPEYLSRGFNETLARWKITKEKIARGEKLDHEEPS